MGIPSPEQDALARLAGDSEGYGGQILDAEIFGTPLAIRLALSANITAGGAATTQQLTAGTGSFTAGRIQDDENPPDAIDIAANGYTELEWCVEATTDAVDAADYEFRVVVDGVALDTYSQTPSLTIGAGAGAADVAQSAEWSFEGDTFEDFVPEIVAIESRPVVADAPIEAQLIQDDGLDWLAQYEEPDVPDYQWSGPVQPNAPNDLWDDPWSWQDAAESDDLWQGLTPEAQATVATARQDFGDTFLAFEEDLPFLVIPAGYQQQNGTPPPEPRPIEDAPDFDVEVEDDFFDDFGNVDCEDLAPDDPWDFHAEHGAPDELALLVGVDSEPVPAGTAVADQPPADAWPHDEDAQDAIALLLDGDPVEAPLVDAAPADGWDWLPEVTEEAEYGTDLVGADVILLGANGPEDAWDWSPEHDETLEASSEPVGADAPAAQPPDDPWTFDDEATDPLSLQLEDEPVGADLASADLPADAWDWSDDVSESLEAGTDAVASEDASPEDAWHWAEDVSDDLPTDSQAFADEPHLESAIWPWDDQADDVTLEIVATAPGVVGPNVPPYIEDAWAHDDYCEDLTAELVAAGDVVGENFVPPLIDVRETFPAQADQTTFFSAIESDTFATPQDQDTFTPL